MAFANIVPEPPTDGIVYANQVPLTTTEAALGDAAEVPSVIPVKWGQTVVAIVKVAGTGIIVGVNGYVFLQTDLGDGTWIDVAWCRITQSQGTSTFVICGGGLGAMNNAFQQSRQSGSAPGTQGNGSNAVPLGGRCRFSGFATFIGGSSSVQGTPAAVKVTITYRIQDPR